MFELRFNNLTICVFSARFFFKNMKISNQKRIEKLGIFLIFAIFLDIFVICAHWLIFKQPDLFMMLLLTLFIILIVCLFNLEYTEFENSGLVISIKKKHVFQGKGFVQPMLEFPVENLKKCEIKSQNVYININTDRDKTHTFKVNLKGFGKRQRNEILNKIFQIGEAIID